jgi:hypothetical protein
MIYFLIINKCLNWSTFYTYLPRTSICHTLLKTALNFNKNVKRCILSNIMTIKLYIERLNCIIFDQPIAKIFKRCFNRNGKLKWMTKVHQNILSETVVLWSYGSWIYNYLCNQCLSPLMLWVWISIRVFSRYSGFLRHDITEILLKVVLNTIKQTNILF